MEPTDPRAAGQRPFRVLRLVHPAPPQEPRRRRGVARAVEDVFMPVALHTLAPAILSENQAPAERAIFEGLERRIRGAVRAIAEDPRALKAT
jgi:hypothetical protein